MKETRVYLIDLHKTQSSLKHGELSNDDFMDIAEQQGYVYSLSGFMSSYNTNGLDDFYFHSVIRFI